MIDKEYEWFENYLSGWLQVVKFQGITSNPEPVVTGIPQGSIIGPLLFALHVNNLADACQCSVLMYADDTVLFCA